jgi:hypothetical protein
MNLPRKDRNGSSYVSYSQLSTFKRSEEDYYNNYILNKPFTGNAYTDFGSKVGEALENNKFNRFTKEETDTLLKVKRLDLFERKTILNYDGFYVLGFIDTLKNDYSELIDYKTGGKNKEHQYKEDSYTQLHLYALSLRQETGITPIKASVEFIRRDGNAFKGEDLTVGREVLSIDVDISYKELKRVYYNTLETVKDIEVFYKKHKIK